MLAPKPNRRHIWFFSLSTDSLQSFGESIVKNLDFASTSKDFLFFFSNDHPMISIEKFWNLGAIGWRPHTATSWKSS
jgi:hypothetical protein